MGQKTNLIRRQLLLWATEALRYSIPESAQVRFETPLLRHRPLRHVVTMSSFKGSTANKSRTRPLQRRKTDVRGALTSSQEPEGHEAGARQGSAPSLSAASPTAQNNQPVHTPTTTSTTEDRTRMDMGITNNNQRRMLTVLEPNAHSQVHEALRKLRAYASLLKGKCGDLARKTDQKCNQQSLARIARPISAQTLQPVEAPKARTSSGFGWPTSGSASALSPKRMIAEARMGQQRQAQTPRRTELHMIERTKKASSHKSLLPIITLAHRLEQLIYEPVHM
jgi:hypothetical protein